MQTNAQTSKRGARQDFLHTFAAPRPQRWLIAALVPVNRVLCLGGVPGLRRVPLLGRVPGIRGLADVVRVDLPEAHRRRLLAAVNDASAAFITPNHPEFFTDWMLDKELCTRIAPLTANWATHEVVNGMGRLMQRFWLANNLIAQIPGSEDRVAAGKAFSIDWAARGHAVLLHPEGQVGWHSNYVGPLFPGVIEMALATAARLREQNIVRRVYIAPVVWKLKFERDQEARLRREMRYVERKLELRVEQHIELVERVHEAYAMLLSRDATKWNANISLSAPYWIAQERLLGVLSEQLRQRVSALGASLQGVQRGAGGQSATQAYRGLANAAERHLRELESSHDARAARDLVQDMRRILRLRPEMYPDATLTQEQIAEQIKRLRNDYCFGTLRDSVNRFMPHPAGARVAHVRVPPPLEITPAPTPGVAVQDELLAELRARMQLALNQINAELRARGGVIEYPNPLSA